MNTTNERRTRKTKRTFIFVFCWIASNLAASIWIDKIDSASKLFNPIYMTTTVHEQFAAMLKEHPGTVMLGDSHTWALGQAPMGENHGTSDIMVADVPGTMSVQVSGARAIVLMVGADDIWRGRTAGLPQHLEHLAAALPKNVPLVWSGIPPTNDARLAAVEIQTNEVIQTLCAARAGCAYVDTWKLLMDEKGKPADELLLADGVHMSATGYRRWLRAIDYALHAIEQ